MNKTISILGSMLVLYGLPSVFAAEPVQPQISSGNYMLSLEMASTPAEENTKDLAGNLTVVDDVITFVTKSADGKPVTFSGKTLKRIFLLWFSSDERDSIVTFHLSGELTGKDTAKGKLTIFQTHERVAEGTWTLKRQ